MKDKISKYITYSEGIYSATAKKYNIDNSPSSHQLELMKGVGCNVFDPTRAHFGVPIGVSSFFRSSELNRKIGGSRTSDHMCNIGGAIDIDADIFGGVTNAEIFHYIKDNLDFDQLIWEKGNSKEPAWVHVGYRPQGNRKLVLYK